MRIHTAIAPPSGPSTTTITTAPTTSNATLVPLPTSINSVLVTTPNFSTTMTPKPFNTMPATALVSSASTFTSRIPMDRTTSKRISSTRINIHSLLRTSSQTSASESITSIPTTMTSSSTALATVGFFASGAPLISPAPKTTPPTASDTITIPADSTLKTIPIDTAPTTTNNTSTQTTTSVLITQPLRTIPYPSSGTSDKKQAEPHPSPAPTKRTIVFFTHAPKLVVVSPIQFQYPVVIHETISAMSSAGTLTQNSSSNVNTTNAATINAVHATGVKPTDTQSPNTMTTGASRGSEGTLALQLRISRDFISAYLDPNTPEHMELARNVTAEVSHVFRIRYPNTFVRCEVHGFWNGSVVVNMTLTFQSQEVVPNSSTVVAYLSEAVNTGQSLLDVIPDSIIVWETSRSTTTAPVSEV
ncbi:hypothetical protein AAFF_G00357760 [Aldrovandia affinis]|uniref:SEA domain-containing protein n=1 Tax=Aldrovandia affinis TaxID=143900 RepID=A0AAD7X1A3_9TELE|nr:hypothetical protein AAFF_G00357760 [Aldrovandia affinis]